MNNYPLFDAWYATRATIITSTFHYEEMFYLIKKEVENLNDIVSWATQNEPCSECQMRLRELFTLVGPDGPVFNLPGIEVKRGKVIGIYSIKNSTLFPATLGKCSHGTPYNHYTLNFDNFGLSMPHSLIKTYFPRCRTLFDNICSPGIKESLDLLISVLPNITYGTTLLSTACWLRENVKTERLNNQEIINTILNGYISGGVLISYHQASKNVVEAMASAHDINALSMLLKERLSPQNYMRPTSEPSQGNIQQALKLIGDFKVTIMNIEMIVDCGGVALTPAHTSAGDIWEGSLHKPKSGAAGLASRSTQLPAVMKVGELIKRIRSGSITTLEVYTADQTPLHVMKNTLAQKSHILNVPHTWSFANNRSLESRNMGLSGWMPVNTIYKWNRNSTLYLFVGIEGAKPQDSAVGCFPSFLAVDVQRQCRKAFESLGGTMRSIILPDSIAGIGTNSESGKVTFICNHNLRFRVSGQELIVDGF